jgi:hypothetical protein
VGGTGGKRSLRASGQSRRIPCAALDEEVARNLVLPPHWTTAAIRGALGAAAADLTTAGWLEERDPGVFVVPSSRRADALRRWQEVDADERAVALVSLATAVGRHAVAGGLARWAQIARLVTDPDAVTAELERVEDPNEILADVELVRPMAAFLGSAFEGLTLALRRAGRRAETRDRRNRDRRALETYQPRPALEAALRDLFTPAPQSWAVHLLGSGGVGKTMQLRHAACQLAVPSGALVARVDFDTLSPDFPTRAPGMLLWAFAQDLRAADVDGVAVSWWTSVDNAVRKLHGRVASEGARVDDPDYRSAVFAFRGAIEALSRRPGGPPRPIVLVVDTCEELHKIDAAREPTNLAALFQFVDAVRNGWPGDATGAVLSELRVLFSGRRPLASSGENFVGGPPTLPPRPYLRVVLVEGFDEREARQYLATHSVPDDLVVPILQATALTPHPWPITMAGWRPARGYLPFDLALYARWVAETAPLPTPDELVGAHGSAYVQRRIVERLERPALERALPILTRLGTFDETCLAALGLERTERQVLRDQEWCVTRTVVDGAGRSLEVADIDEPMLRRLEAYFAQSEPDVAAVESVAHAVLGGIRDPNRPCDPLMFAAAFRTLWLVPRMHEELREATTVAVASLDDGARNRLLQSVEAVLDASPTYADALRDARWEVRLMRLAWTVWDEPGSTVAHWTDALATIESDATHPQYLQRRAWALAGRVIAGARGGDLELDHVIALDVAPGRAPEPLLAAIWASVDWLLHRSPGARASAAYVPWLRAALKRVGRAPKFYGRLLERASGRQVRSALGAYSRGRAVQPWLRGGRDAEALYDVLLALEFWEPLSAAAKLVSDGVGWHSLFRAVLALQGRLDAPARNALSATELPDIGELARGNPIAWSPGLPEPLSVAALARFALGDPEDAVRILESAPPVGGRAERMRARHHAVLSSDLRLFFGDDFYRGPRSLRESATVEDFDRSLAMDGLLGRPISELPRIEPSLPLRARLALFHACVRSLHHPDANEIAALVAWTQANRPLGDASFTATERDLTSEFGERAAACMKLTHALDWLELERIAQIEHTPLFTADRLRALAAQAVAHDAETFAQYSRAAALLGTGWPRVVGGRIGVRACAWRALAEGEMLALRFRTSGAHLLERASELFAKAQDSLGQLLADTALVLARGSLDGIERARGRLRASCALVGLDARTGDWAEALAIRDKLHPTRVRVALALGVPHAAEVARGEWTVAWPDGARPPAELWTALGTHGVAPVDRESRLVQVRRTTEVVGSRGYTFGAVEAKVVDGILTFSVHADPLLAGWGMESAAPRIVRELDDGRQFTIFPDRGSHGPRWEALYMRHDSPWPEIRRIAGTRPYVARGAVSRNVKLVASAREMEAAVEAWERGAGVKVTRTWDTNAETGVIHLIGRAIEDESVSLQIDERDSESVLRVDAVRRFPGMGVALVQGTPYESLRSVDASARSEAALLRWFAAELATEVPVVFYVPPLRWSNAIALVRRLAQGLFDARNERDVTILAARLRDKLRNSEEPVDVCADVGVYCMNKWRNNFS